MQLNHGHIPRLNYHTRRLCHSCSQLGFQFSENAWYSYIEKLKQNNKNKHEAIIEKHNMESPIPMNVYAEK